MFKKIVKISTAVLIGLSVVATFQACSRESKIASYNLSREADSFEIKRRVVFFNGITGKYVMEIIGYCSIDKDNKDNQLEVTCKVGKDKYKKHYFGLSDNTAYFVEQIDPKTVSQYNYKIIFRPQTIIPDITVKVTKDHIAPTPQVKIGDEK